MKRLLIYSIAILILQIGCSRKEKIVYVTIPKGANISSIAHRLKTKNVISSENTFKIIVKLKGKEKSIKSGTYKFKRNMSVFKVIEMLLEGETEQIKITIPEGYNIRNITKLIEKCLNIKKSIFINYAYDKTVLKKYGIKGESLEGFLFPDTYNFSRFSNLDEIVKVLINHFNEVYEEESARYVYRKNNTRMNIITMASLIQAEAKFTSEMPMIASVYYNRLKKGYRLECDPTVIYAMGYHKERLTYKDLKYKSPYNTYIYYGLPPGPICNPGRMAIRAALYPAQTNYLYFVADVDGHHLFSLSLKEHNKKIRIVRNRRKSLLK